jgi:hypothetical protein
MSGEGKTDEKIAQMQWFLQLVPWFKIGYIWFRMFVKTKAFTFFSNF